jgi:hypothetical protein
MPTLLAMHVRTTNNEGEVITTAVKSSENLIKINQKLTRKTTKLRPESPDVTRAAKKLEMTRQCNSSATMAVGSLGAIAKVKSRMESPTASTASTASNGSSTIK